MKNLLIIILILLFSTVAFSQKKGKIIYKYKKYQEFDLEDLKVEGGSVLPLDLSSKSRLQREFSNRLPLRKNFNPEIKRSVEIVR